jgi:hypothetical protein
MNTEPKSSFDHRCLVLPLEKILPIRVLKEPEKHLTRFLTIAASIREVGILEPLIVFPQKGSAGFYLLLDGHMRYHALKDMGETEVACLVSTDDESYTYNHRVNRLAPIQEHAMIMRAVRNGVSPDRIAATLNVGIAVIKSNMNLLVGIHADVVELLKDKHLTPAVFNILKKVTPLRQIEMAELMVAANNYTKGYALALFAGTNKGQLLNPDEPKKAKGVSAEEFARMEQELESLQGKIKAVETSHGETVLNLTIAKSYLRKLIDNSKVVRFLATHHGEYLSEFQRLVNAEAI